MRKAGNVLECPITCDKPHPRSCCSAVWLPSDLGLEPDGISNSEKARTQNTPGHLPVSADWTLSRAVRTQRFRWLAMSYFCGLFTWYAVQVHQTKYLTEVGFDPSTAAWALGLVSLVAVPGQIALGHLSDRIGREWAWSIGNGGFALSCAVLLALRAVPSTPLLWLMVITQGTLGYGLTSVMGAIPMESFGGRHSGSIFGTVMLAAILGGAAGPWVAGVLHDVTGSYSPAFWLTIVCSSFSAIAIWRAAPDWSGGIRVEGKS
jgi:MFS family permease